MTNSELLTELLFKFMHYKTCQIKDSKENSDNTAYAYKGYKELKDEVLKRMKKKDLKVEPKITVHKMVNWHYEPGLGSTREHLGYITNYDCGSCGKRIEDKFEFCPYCGTRIDWKEGNS